MTHRLLSLASACALALCAASSMAQTSTDNSASKTNKGTDDTPDSFVLIVPMQLSTQTMSSGCWAEFFTEKNFKGDVTTLLGPTELRGFDKSAGRQLKRDMDSLIIGPKATLTVYEHQMFKDHSVQFQPDSKVGGLTQKLGFGGRIQSLKLDCAK